MQYMWCLLVCDTQDKFDIERGGNHLSLRLCLYSIPGSQDFFPRFCLPPVDLPVNKEQGGPILVLISAVTIIKAPDPKAKDRWRAFKRHSLSA
jgi:hypothetical protein